MLGTLLIVGGISAGGVWAVSRYAHLLGLVDRPNARSSHVHPTPRAGGLGLLLAWAVVVVLVAPPWPVALSCAALSLVGFWDDVANLSARLRLVLQLVLASAVVLFLPAPSGFLGLLLAPLAVLYIVGTANFFNFMDGINGMAGIMGVVSLGLVAWMTWPAQGATSEVALLMSVACLAFLPFNLPRARVFMGDVGSLLIGFLFGTLVVSSASDLPSFLCLASFQVLFYADTLSTLLIRWRDGERLSQAHRRHLYQLLANEQRMPHVRVSLLYGSLQAFVGGLMILAWHMGLVWQLLLTVAVCSVFLVFMVRIRRMAGQRGRL